MSVEDLENTSLNQLDIFFTRQYRFFPFNNYINFYTKGPLCCCFPHLKGETSATNVINPLASNLYTAWETSTRPAGAISQWPHEQGRAQYSASFHGTESSPRGSQCDKQPASMGSWQSFPKWTQHLRQRVHGFAPHSPDLSCGWR